MRQARSHLARCLAECRPAVVKVLDERLLCESGGLKTSCLRVSVGWTDSSDLAFPLPTAKICIAMRCQINIHICYCYVPGVCFCRCSVFRDRVSSFSWHFVVRCSPPPHMAYLELRTPYFAATLLHSLAQPRV